MRTYLCTDYTSILNLNNYINLIFWKINCLRDSIVNLNWPYLKISYEQFKREGAPLSVSKKIEVHTGWCETKYYFIYFKLYYVLFVFKHIIYVLIGFYYIELYLDLSVWKEDWLRKCLHQLACRQVYRFFLFLYFSLFLGVGVGVTLPTFGRWSFVVLGGLRKYWGATWKQLSPHWWTVARNAR